MSAYLKENGKWDRGEIESWLAGTEQRAWDRNDLPHILNSLGLVNIGAEIGIRYGEYSEVILEHWKGEVLICVDAWKHLPEYQDMANVAQSEQDQIYEDCRLRLQRFDDRVWIRREMSDKMPMQSQSPGRKCRPLDFVYLDADHSLAAMRRDIRLWAAMLQPGSILAGHDYVPDGEYCEGVFGVKTAVDEWCRTHNCAYRLKVATEPWPSWMVRL